MVLNYDNLLEKAISLYNPSHQFNELYDYVNPNRSINVVKFHGSINWFWSMGEGGWYEQLREFDLDNPPDQIAVINDVTRVSEYPKDNQKYYPVLTAPLAGKGLVDAVCPKNHLEAAREFLEYCTKFLVIGTSAQDEDLLEFLDDAVRVEPELVDVVDPIDPQAVLARFRAGIHSFRQPGVEFQKRTHQIEFRKYVADEAIRAFGRFEA